MIKRQIIQISKQTNLPVVESWSFPFTPVECSEFRTSASSSGAAVDDEDASPDGAAEDAADAQDGGIIEAA